MSKKNQETIISRVMLMLVGCGFVAFLMFLYTLPFQKQSLQINYYYKTIEYVTMGVSFALLVASVIYLYMSRTKDMSNRIVTPHMLSLLALTVFVSSIIIPLSNNRGRFMIISIIATVFVFLAYATYNLVNKTFAFQTSVCGIYFILLRLFGIYYSVNVTFEDRINLDVSVAYLLFAAVVALILLASVLIAYRNKQFKLWHTVVLSFVPVVSLIVRNFVTEYVDILSLIALSAVYVALIVVTKVFKK